VPQFLRRKDDVSRDENVKEFIICNGFVGWMLAGGVWSEQ
jgi:hypothetical protein